MRKIYWSHLALGLAVQGTAACTTVPHMSAAAAPVDAAQLPVLVRQSARNAMALQALFLGRLHLDANGCLRAGNEVGPIIIWHHDTRIERAPDGRIRIVDATSGVGVEVGDEIALSGGYRAGTVTNVTEPVPRACQPQSRFFVAGPIMSEAQRQDLLERQRNRTIAPPPPVTMPK